MPDLDYLTHSHFYIVSKVTGATLGVDGFASEDGGMTGHTTINQYVKFGDEDQYNEAFKFSFRDMLDGTHEITSKRTGMSIGACGDFEARMGRFVEGSQIVQCPSEGSTNLVAQRLGFSRDDVWRALPARITGATAWVIEEQSDGVFSLRNSVTKAYLSVPDKRRRDDQPVVQHTELSDLGHWEFRQAGMAQFNMRSDISDLELQSDMRDNAYFKLAVPQPGDIPMVGNTAAAKIDAFGKLIHIFPDQNATEELYKALVKAIEQIVDVALLKNRIINIKGELNEVRLDLQEAHDHMTPKHLYDWMQRAVDLYNGPIGDLRTDENRKAGLPFYIQAATEQLTILRAMAMIDCEENNAQETWLNLCQKHHDHVNQTYQDMLSDRLSEKILTKEGGPTHGFLGMDATTLVHSRSHDLYQPAYVGDDKSINGKLMAVWPPSTKYFDMMYRWRQQQMSHEFNIEYGDVAWLLWLWREGIKSLRADSATQ